MLLDVRMIASPPQPHQTRLSTRFMVDAKEELLVLFNDGHEYVFDLRVVAMAKNGGRSRRIGKKRIVEEDPTLFDLGQK